MMNAAGGGDGWRIPRKLAAVLRLLVETTRREDNSTRIHHRKTERPGESVVWHGKCYLLVYRRVSIRLIESVTLYVRRSNPLWRKGTCSMSFTPYVLSVQ